MKHLLVALALAGGHHHNQHIVHHRPTVCWINIPVTIYIDSGEMVMDDFGYKNDCGGDRSRKLGLSNPAP